MKKLFVLLILFGGASFGIGTIAGGEQKKISDLINRFSHKSVDDTTIQEIGQYGEKLFVPLIEAIKTNKLTFTVASQVFHKLQAPSATKKLVVFLEDDDVRVCELVAQNLAVNGNKSAVPALVNALRRFRKARIAGNVNARTFPPDGRIHSAERQIALALWKVGKNTETAREILEHARTCESYLKYELFEIIDSPFSHLLMPEKERLDFIMNYLIPRLQGPVPLSVDLSTSNMEDQLLPVNEDLQLLKKYRGKVLPVMRKRLQNSGAADAALTLGYLKDTESLSKLRELLVHSRDGYGWETNFPDDLSSEYYPKYHAYEEAIAHITGKSLEEFVSLTPTETQSLIRRYRDGDASALYILGRFYPGIAKQEIIRKYKETKKGEWQMINLCTMIARHCLQTGASKKEVEEILGKPDLILPSVPRKQSRPGGRPGIYSENKWGYVCDSSDRGISLVFDGETLVKIELKMNLH